MSSDTPRTDVFPPSPWTIVRVEDGEYVAFYAYNIVTGDKLREHQTYEQALRDVWPDLLPYPSNREECDRHCRVLWSQYLSDGTKVTYEKYKMYRELLDTKYAEPWGV